MNYNINMEPQQVIIYNKQAYQVDAKLALDIIRMQDRLEEIGNITGWDLDSDLYNEGSSLSSDCQNLLQWVESNCKPIANTRFNFDTHRYDRNGIRERGYGGFYVLNESGLTPPKFCHTNFSSALAEAQRLHEATKATTHVLGVMLSLRKERVYTDQTVTKDYQDDLPF